MPETKFYVGKTMRLCFKLERIHPVTEVRTPVDDPNSATVVLHRPDETVLATKELAEIEEHGGGYYSATFEPDKAGWHTGRITAVGADGRTARDVVRVYVYKF